jgi:ribonuclease BN (tRNA processing enzyme)
VKLHKPVLLLALALMARPLPAGNCGRSGVALQILGSGGPVADDGRAASGYLVWHEGRARVLVDAGGGVFLRFGQAGARLEDMDLLALTHLHTDHAADLPALLMGGYFSPRSSALPVSGPTGNRLMPSITGFLAAMFSGEHGAFRYLSGFLDGTDGLFALQPIEVDADSREPVEVYSSKDLRVTAVGVVHGPIPSLGYLVEIAGRRIAIGGDQNLDEGAFVRLATAADIMVLPMAVPEDAGPVARNLHATPAEIGSAAARAGPARLVVSHLMQRSLQDLEAGLDEIRRHYSGSLVVAEDLTCLELGRAGPAQNTAPVH